MKRKVVVSFCISAYNRKDMVLELVNHILTSQRDDFEVVVVDDCSSDDLIGALSEIKDERLVVSCHEINMGGKKTWYDALQKGSGEWLFQVIDRDWINIDLLEQLIESLNELSKENVSFAVAGERLDASQKYIIYDEGEAVHSEFSLRDSHPTGQIFRKQFWDLIEDKEQFFIDEKYGLYPHGYIYAILGNFSKGAYLLFDITDREHYSQRVANSSNSNIYSNKIDKSSYWFMPTARNSLLYLAVENSFLILDDLVVKNVVLNRYWRYFNCVTYEFWNTCHNETIKRRYGCEDLTTNYLSLIANAYDYSLGFREYLANNDFAWCDDSFYLTLNKIDEKLLSGLFNWTLKIKGAK